MYISIETIKKHFQDRDSLFCSFAKPRGIVRFSETAKNLPLQRQELYYIDSFAQLDQLKPEPDRHFFIRFNEADPKFTGKLKAYAKKYTADILAMRYYTEEEPQLFSDLHFYFESQIAFACFSDSLLEILAEKKAFRRWSTTHLCSWKTLFSSLTPISC